MGLTQNEEIGLTTKEALNRLHKDIEQVLNQFLTSQKSRKSKSCIRDSLHHSSNYTTINWITALCLLLISVSFMAANILDSNLFLIPQGVLILIFLLLDVTIEFYDNKLRHNEVPNRVRIVLDKIRQETNRVNWLPENYPQLCSPYSPCITLQWTYRDKQLVNLPWSLLVKDDVILIRPGQISPGYCEAVDKSNEYSLLHAKEVYGPSLQSANEIFSNPKARKPLEYRKFKLLETPYLNNLRVALEQSLDKPVTQLNQQRHLVMIRIMERFILPIMLLTVYIINLVRYLYLHSYFGRGNAVDMFLITPFSTILPLLPVIFPIIWNMLNYLGLARFKTLFDATVKLKITENPFEEDHDKLLLNNKGLMCSKKDIWTNFISVFMGQSDIMVHSSNVVHVLGSMTALCCVDKKGILSWPNPTAEKVFFLHNKENVSQSSSLANLNELNVDPESTGSTPRHNYQNEGSNMAIAEVLDLTHNLNDPFKLHFDDMKWHKHMNSLKPLGLAILLNTCNLETKEQYTAFCAHVTCEAMYNEHLVPVTNRRCLCELAKEIGFVDQAQKVFNLEQQLFSYRHLQPEMVRRDYKYARSLHLSTKLKFPFPHMFAVLVKEISSGSIQLLSEGTADIILDSCVDYWDGHDLCTLTLADRKKVQDFYQRSSLTAYCTAFAYRPLNKIVSNKLSHMYLELPSDCRNLYLNQHSPTSMHWDCRSVLEPKIRTHYSQFYSTDSLLYNDSPCSDVTDAESCFEMQCNQVFIGMVTMQYQAIYDMVQLIEQLERACIRFVHFSKENELRSRVFSEKMGLESGWNCHISLLSERNRRDSGLQETWSNNVTSRTHSPSDYSQRKLLCARRLLCSASPTNDVKSPFYNNSNLNSSRTMSFSAPCAINMEHSLVKFDMEHGQLTQIYSDNNSNADGNNATSQEQIECQTADVNAGTHDWQSLSCLTDSTEQSAPINFDMSNRAKLPRGIDKIRPHIELIDNVPLLVSLFTDCTATVTREMLHIMQDYGEVVCVLGSSANCDNIGIFMQADASIAVEPLYPQVCQREEAFKKIPDNPFISPTELSRSLNSIACSLSVKREDPNTIYHLIMEARDYTAHLWSAVQFWLCCCFTLSLMQLVASIFMLPSPLTVGQIMWFICFVVPLISTSLIFYKTNPDVMKKPQGKNQIVLNMEVIFFILWSYGLKFIPTVFVVIMSFVGILASHCTITCEIHNCTCALFYIPVNEINSGVTIGGWVEMSYTLLTSRQIIVLIILLHFATISVCFVHRDYSLWNYSPHINIFWLITIIVLVTLHTIYTILSFNDIFGNFEKLVQFSIPISVIAFAFSSPLIILFTNELIKQQEIKVNKRFQRRARLDFGTKLGMNSPF